MARTEKDNFIFYHQWFEWLDGLNGRQIKLIFTAIREYRVNGAEIDDIYFGKDIVAKQMAIVIISCINSTEKKYEQVSEMRAENRRKKQNEQTETKLTNDNKSEQKKQNTTKKTNDNKKNKTQQNEQTETKLTNDNKINKSEQNDYRIEKNRIEKNRIDLSKDKNIGENEIFCEAEIVDLTEKEMGDLSKTTSADYKNEPERFDFIFQNYIINSREFQQWVVSQKIDTTDAENWISEFANLYRLANDYSVCFSDIEYKSKCLKHLVHFLAKKQREKLSNPNKEVTAIELWDIMNRQNIENFNQQIGL